MNPFDSLILNHCVTLAIHGKLTACCCIPEWSPMSLSLLVATGGGGP
jgi:hypothetical protein